MLSILWKWFKKKREKNGFIKLLQLLKKKIGVHAMFFPFSFYFLKKKSDANFLMWLFFFLCFKNQWHFSIKGNSWIKKMELVKDARVDLLVNGKRGLSIDDKLCTHAAVWNLFIWWIFYFSFKNKSQFTWAFSTIFLYNNNNLVKRLECEKDWSQIT